MRIQMEKNWKEPQKKEDGFLNCKLIPFQYLETLQDAEGNSRMNR